MAKTKPEVSVKIYVEKIDNLIHNEANPRYIKSKRHADLMKSLKEFPEMKLLREIIVDENMLLLAGDKRTYALKELGYTDVTIKQVFGLTEAQKREFIIKDNDHNGEWDTDVLANQWDITELEKWGVPNFNFGDVKDEPNEPASKDDQSKVHICPNCEFEFED